ncbi:uncharacterized protein N7479_005504 [Penicillium vulpinum]|uniref:uncharacterized protein n=1 Tax=Penicillium vulpinum TaxID=29845 RepID=UPI002546FAF0|nr:uncharacterized protein N7479_005504 [Penicillium vulpinum]KAJ5958354.1 hypothetical protein N7479_005504 [Penicillium vulpinum]
MTKSICLLLLIRPRIQGPILTITVGASREPFHVHESIICASSLFFKTAMSGSWKKSNEYTLELPEDDPRTFALYSHWLYFAKIPVRYLPHQNTVNFAFYNTTNSAEICSLFVDMYVYSAEAGSLSTEFSKEFLFSVAEAFIKKRSPLSKRFKVCDYYVRPAREGQSLKRKRIKTEL